MKWPETVPGMSQNLEGGKQEKMRIKALEMDNPNTTNDRA
jgi:hypothetical protein